MGDECIQKGKIRIGWSVVKNIDDINNGNWSEIKRQIKQDYDDRKKKMGASQIQCLRTFL